MAENDALAGRTQVLANRHQRETTNIPPDSLLKDHAEAVTTAVEPERWDPNADIGPHNWESDYTRILLLTQEGKSSQAIREKLKIPGKVITKVRNSTYFIQKLAALNTRTLEKVTETRSVMLATDKARQLLTEAAIPAAQIVIKLARTGTSEDRIKLLACQDILDRAGLRPIEVIETRERIYSPEEVVHAREVLKETQEIVMRLSNQTSPFILESDKVKDAGLASSSDGQAHAPQPKNSEAAPV